MKDDDENKILALTPRQLLLIEIVRADWPKLVSWRWAQTLTSRIMAWRANRLYKQMRRYQARLEISRVYNLNPSRN